MAVSLKKLKRLVFVLFLIVATKALTIASELDCRSTNENNTRTNEYTSLENELKEFVDETLNEDSLEIVDGISIQAINANASETTTSKRELCKSSPRSGSFQDYVQNRFDTYARTHVVSVHLPNAARLFKIGTGKSSFLTGFGLGFLAFGLKKLLLPMFIGAQILKSVLIAMFLPSILGSIGKLLGKGISHASSFSGSSGHGQQQQQTIDDFDFKETGTPYNADGTQDDYAAVLSPDFNNNNNYGADMSTTIASPTDTAAIIKQAMNRYGQDTYYQKVYVQPQSDSYYMRRPTKQHDYKVFHKIPSSSLLLTTYDPFYSPLLSRLDSVFQQLGLGAASTSSANMEKCRERLICLMYANPAKYAPYSNLVSAQLSRELNELRKPSTDNPEILRFFRYMKAAKDGQDENGQNCEAHKGCPMLATNRPSPAMLTTFNDINKLVQARSLRR